MPINIYTGKSYKFDFNSLTNIPTSYYNSKEFLIYLHDWETLLNKFDKNACTEYTNFINSCNTFSAQPEYFQFSQPFIDGSAPYIFHFNIERILFNINNSHYHTKTTLMKSFIKSVSYDTTIILDDRKVKKTPIIICELLMPKYKYVVIDGNTRLNYFLKNNKWFVQYTIYAPNQKNDFLLSVDWAMYHFTTEVNKIIQDYNNDEKMIQNIKNSKIYNQMFIDEFNREY